MRKRMLAAGAAFVMTAALAGCGASGDATPQVTPRTTPSPAVSSSPAATPTSSPTPTPTPSAPASTAPSTCEDVTPELYLAKLQREHPSVSVITDDGPFDFEERGLVTEVFACLWGPADIQEWGDMALVFGSARVLDESGLVAAIEQVGLTEVPATSGRLFYSTGHSMTETPIWVVDGAVHWASYVDQLQEWTGFAP